MLKDIEPSSNRFAQAVLHKQQLEKIVNFSDKLKYWKENIDNDPAAQVRDKEGIRCILKLLPNSDEERRIFYEYKMDYDRAEFANTKHIVYQEGLRRNRSVPPKITFIIQSFDALKADLSVRLSRSERKRDLLQAELTTITNSIETASITTWGEPSALAQEINNLRNILETNRKYDFNFKDEYAPVDKAVVLAIIWDIIEYEHYLKDELAKVDINLSTPLDSQDKNRTVTDRQEPEPEPTITSFTELFYTSEEMQNAIEVLYKTTTNRKFKVIDLNRRWIGKKRDGSRSVLLAWIEVLSIQGWFEFSVPNKQMNELLNSYFSGLNLHPTDDSLWRKQKESKVANMYYADFLQLIKRRKLR